MFEEAKAVNFSKPELSGVPGVLGFIEKKKINPKTIAQNFIAGVIWVWRPLCSLTTEQANKQTSKQAFYLA